MKAAAKWVDGMRDRDVAIVARALGIDVTETKGLASPGHFPCPKCGAASRHTKTGDRRGACSIAPGGKGWNCKQCDSSGDALALVLTVQVSTAREWCLRWLGLDGSPPAPASRAAGLSAAASSAPSYPPAAELRALWERAVRVDRDPDVARYLEARGLDVDRIAGEDLARALPRSGACPAWAHHSPDGSYQSWAASNHRLLVPVVDARGLVRSVIARRVDRRPKDPRKSASPAKYQRAGLVMACRIAERVLELGAFPPLDVGFPKPELVPWPAAAPVVVVTEGEIDFLAWACAASDANEAPHATFGLYSGSWSADVAARIPDGSIVRVATDNDDEGNGYARKVAASFDGRALELRRHRYGRDAA